MKAHIFHSIYNKCNASFFQHVCDACKLNHCSDCLARISGAPQQANFDTSSASMGGFQATSFVSGFNTFASNLISGQYQCLYIYMQYIMYMFFF